MAYILGTMNVAQRGAVAALDRRLGKVERTGRRARQIPDPQAMLLGET